MSTSRYSLRQVVPATISALAAISLLAACGGGGFDEDKPAAGASGDSSAQASDAELTVLIGSSGDAETKAVTDAVAAWSKESGIAASVQAASDLNQQLSQGFAAGTPADVFYLSSDTLPGFASNGSVVAYGDKLANKDDFYPALVDNFTYDGDFYCAPKDFSTLALVINNTLWADAGLTDADYPKTWDDLATVAKKLSDSGTTGLAFGAEYQRVGVFMAEAGGGLVSDGAAVADSAQNQEALTYVKDNIAAGNFAFAADLGAGWGGEAFGQQSAAMVIEGNWVTGALKNDYPDIDYTVVELPAGPGGQGTLQFTNCWGMAADSPNQDAALDLIEYLTATDQQLAFADAFGVMPSVKSAGETWKENNPTMAAFLAGADYAQFLPPINGIADVIADFNSQLEGLGSTDVESILKTAQSNLEAVTQ